MNNPKNKGRGPKTGAVATSNIQDEFNLTQKYKNSKNTWQHKTNYNYRNWETEWDEPARQNGKMAGYILWF